MCGICGACFTESGRPVERDLLERMCAVIVHRGPDEQGIHIDGPVGLGIRRLSIIDLAGGSQPIFNEDRTVVVVFNGEIYNFKQLRGELTRDGHRFATQGDTEVIVHLYEEYGIDFVTHLNGMFAVALWDGPRRRFLLVRDRLGQKPLYYAQTRDGLIFGSEIKCLLQCKDIPAELDRESVYHYFTLGYIPHPKSVFRRVRQVPPAGRLVLQQGRPKVDRYWRLPCNVNPATDRQQAREQIREVLEDATRLRMISDVPLGAFLSGGLDSSITVALMANHSPSPVTTFHIDFGEPEMSEIAYARQVAERYGTDHHELVVKPSAMEALNDLVGFLDEPFGDSSFVPTFYVSQLAREHVTVALAGDGGDEAFGGYRRYQRILARRELPHLARAGIGFAGRLVHGCLPRSAPGRRYFRTLGLDNPRAFTVGAAEMETRELLSKEFLDSLDGACTFDLLRPSFPSPDPSDPLARYTYFDTQRYLPDDILVKVDRMSMANSLEVRSPFLDHRVFELAATFPYHWKIDGADTKVILKETFAADLPPDVLKPRKRGFSMPIAQWLKGDLRGALHDALHDRQMMASGLFCMSELHAFAREHLSDRRDRSDLLWRYLVFVRWWQQRPLNGAVRSVLSSPKTVVGD